MSASHCPMCFVVLVGGVCRACVPVPRGADEVDLEVCADCGGSTAVGSPDPHECVAPVEVSDELADAVDARADRVIAEGGGQVTASDVLDRAINEALDKEGWPR
jgi:hypothetical protein